MPTVAILMTCHNRKALTLAALRAATAAATSDIALRFYVTDDGCTDGTVEAIRQEFPNAVVICGDGNLYWNGGMRRSWQRALVDSPDYYLWLNDDLSLLPNSLGRIIDDYIVGSKYNERSLIVGKTTDPDTGAVSYGGLVRAEGVSRLRFRRLRGTEQLCDTMNGNCVLLPARAVRDIGIHADRFTHSFGDMDYGLRARRAGYQIIECAEPVAHQVWSGGYTSPKSLALRDIVAFLTHPKGMPLKEWLYFSRTHGGWLWPLNFASMYIKPFLHALRTPALFARTERDPESCA